MRPSYQSPITSYPFPSLLRGPVTPCPPSLPHPHRIQILRLFLILLWKLTNVRLRKILPTTRSFLGFNPVNPPRLSSPSFKSKSPASSQSQNSDDGLTKWVTPTVNVLYSFSGTLGGVVGLVNITIFPYHIVQSNIYLPGIPTSEHNFYGDWCSSPGPCLSRFPCTTYFNTLTLRRLKMSALAVTSLSTSLAASRDFSNGLRFTLASHRLRL
jgi:hypothetical protein